MFDNVLTPPVMKRSKTIKQKEVVDLQSNQFTEGEENNLLLSEDNNEISQDEFIQSEDDLELREEQDENQAANEHTIKNQMDILNGVSQRLLSFGSLKSSTIGNNLIGSSKAGKLAADTSNQATIQKYSSVSQPAQITFYQDFKGVIRLFFVLFFDFDTIVLLLYLTSQITLSPQNKFDYLPPVFLLLFQLGLKLAIELFTDNRQRTISYQFNYGLIKKYFKARLEQTLSQKRGSSQRREGTFAFDLWQNIQIGDVIIMKQGQEFPADVLIIDSEYLQSSGTKRQSHQQNQENQNNLLQALKENIHVQSGSNSQFKIRNKTCFKGTFEKNRNEGQSRVSPLQVVQSLTGTLIWEWNKIGFFTGQFRFANNSGSYDLTPENIVQQGSFLRSPHKLVCLVLNVGQTCQSALKRQPNLSLLSIIKSKLCFSSNHYNEAFIQWFRILSLILFLVFVLFESLKWKREDLSAFYLNVLGQDLRSFDTAIWLGNLLKQFNCCVLVLPLFSNLLAQLVTITQAFFVEWDVNLVPAAVKFNNFNAMAKLSWIQHVVTSPSALEGDQTFKVNYFRIADHGFHHDPSAQKSNQAHPDQQLMHQNQSDSDDSQTQELQHLDYLPNQQLYEEQVFSHPKVDEMSKDPCHPQREHFYSFLKCLTLCHQATHKKDNTVSNSQEIRIKVSSLNPEEESQLTFASQFNCHFIKRSGAIITINIDGKSERFEELAQFQMKVSQKHSLVTVQILRQIQKNPTIVINMRGSVHAALSACRSGFGYSKVLLLSEAERLSSLGYNMVTFCQKELTKDESTALKQKIDAVSTFSKTFKSQLAKAVLEYLNNMSVVGTIGLQKTVPLRNTLMVEDLISNRVKVWLLSQASQRKTQINCANLDIYGESEIIELKGKNDREIEDSIRSCFNQIFDSEQKQLQQQKKKTENNEAQNQSLLSKLWQNILQRNNKVHYQANSEDQNRSRTSQKKRKRQKVNQIIERPKRILTFTGYQLNILLRDENQMRIFLALAMYCDIILGAEISPESKGRLSHELVRFQHKGKDENKGYVMGLIGSPEDRNLVEKEVCDVSVCLLANYNNKQQQIESDITLMHPYALTYMLFKHGSQLHRRLTVLGRFAIRRAIFMCILLLVFYFQTGGNFKVPFDNVVLTYSLVVLFLVSAYVSAIFYETDGFNFLHRINGQYNCNQTFKVLSFKHLPSLFIETVLDILIIVLVAGYDGVNNATLSLNEGKPFTNRSLMLLKNIVYVMHTTCIFLKFPVISRATIYTLLIQLIFTILITIFQDSFMVMDGNIWQKIPFLQLLLIFCLFGLKIYFKQAIRQLIKATGKWDKFNAYIKERLYFEHYESYEQLKHISLDNRRHQQSMIDINELEFHRILTSINKNLHQLTYRNELTEMLFEKIGYLSTIKNSSLQQQYEDNQQGLGTAHQLILKESQMQINKVFMNFKFSHQKADFKKHIFLNLKIDEFVKAKTISSVLLLAFMFFGLMGLQLACYRERVEASQYCFFLIDGIVCTIAALLLNCDWIVTKDKVLVALSIFITLLTMIQVHLNLNFTHFNDSQFIIAAFLCFVVFNRKILLYETILLILGVAIWFFILAFNSPVLDNQSSESSQPDRETQAYLTAFSIPCFVLLLSIYAYSDEYHRKIRFLTLDKQIKGYKKLRSGVQKLVPEVVQKSKQKKDDIVELNKQVVFVSFKIANYTHLVNQRRSEYFLPKIQQQIYKGVDKLVQKHGLLRFNAFEDGFEVAAGFKLFETLISQKLQSAPPIQRACRFAFDLIDLTEQLSTQTKQQIQFQVVIHCPTNVVSGVMGQLRQNLCFISPNLYKSALIMQKTQPNQICISKSCYDALAASNIHQLIRVTETIKIDNGSTEQIFELIDRKKAGGAQQSNIRQNIRIRKLQKTGKANQDDKMKMTLPQIGELDRYSSGVSSGFNGTQQESDVESRQYQESEYQEKIQVGKNFVKADYQSLYQSIKEFKDDQEISYNDVLNNQYKLVTRPKWLCKFRDSGPSKIGERKYQWQMSYEYLWTNLFFSVLQITIMFALIFFFTQTHNRLEQNMIYLEYLWLLPYLLLNFIVQHQYFALQENKMYLLRIYFYLNAIATTTFTVLNGLRDKTPLNTSSQNFLVITALLSMFCQRGILFKDFFISSLLISSAQIAVLILNEDQSNFLHTATQAFSLIILEMMLLITHHEKEMQRRTEFNRHIILSVESKKNKDVAGKIMPIQALAALQHEESFVQSIRNGTMLVFQLQGLKEFVTNQANDDKLKFAFEFLSQLYTTFDQMIEHYGLFKVQSDNQNYVVMSDPTTLLQQQSLEAEISQADRLCQLGAEMIQVVQKFQNEKLEQVADMDTSQFLMRIGSTIGIHTGSLLTCITGSKLLEYKVFGRVAQKCMLAREQAPINSVCVTKQTKMLLELVPDLTPHLEFTEHLQVIREGAKGSFTTYILTVKEPEFSQRSHQDEQDSQEDELSEESDHRSSSMSASEASASDDEESSSNKST